MFQLGPNGFPAQIAVECMPALYGEAECVSLPSMPSLGVHFKDRCFVPQLAAQELHIPDRASGDINGLEVFTFGHPARRCCPHCMEPGGATP